MTTPERQPDPNQNMPVEVPFSIEELGQALFGVFGQGRDSGLSTMSSFTISSSGLFIPAPESRHPLGEIVLDPSDRRLFSEYEADDVFNLAKTFAEYSKENGIADIIFLDRSARTAWVPISEYWKQAYPDTSRPNMHFIAPDFIRTTVNEVLDGSTFSAYRKVSRLNKNVGKQLKDAGSTLLNSKDKPVLIFDPCIHTGETAFWTREALIGNGFKDVRIGTATDEGRPYALATADVAVTSDWRRFYCAPFGHDDDLLEVTEGSIYTTPNSRNRDLNRPYSVALRKELKTIIAERFDEQDQ